LLQPLDDRGVVIAFPHAGIRLHEVDERKVGHIPAVGNAVAFQPADSLAADRTAQLQQ
jgi:hypothetical protein